MRVFKYKWFARFAEKEAISDDDLREAVREIEAGLAEANYGGDVYKKRVARRGEGKRGGYRTIVFFRSGDRTFFVYGFAKSKRDNISEKEERSFRKDAKKAFAWSDEALAVATQSGNLIEI